MRTTITTIISIFIFTYCNAQTVTKSLTTDGDSIAVIPIDQPIPDSCLEIGPIKVGDNGYEMGCSYNSILKFARLITWRAKGNVLKVNTIKSPDWCECFRLYGTVYSRKNIHKVDDSLAKVKFGDTPGFALLYVYWPKYVMKSLIKQGYKVRMGDSIIGPIRNNWGYEVKIYKEGKMNVWGETEVKNQVQLDIKFGREYYVVCTIRPGGFVSEPNVYTIAKEAGQMEYKNVESKNVILKCTASTVKEAPITKEDEEN